MKSALITFEYDETQPTLCKTFGTRSKRLAEIAGSILSNDQYKTLTSGVVAELEGGKITGGELLALATVAVAKLQEDFKRDMLMRKVFAELLKNGGPPGMKGFALNVDELPEEVREFFKKLEEGRGSEPEEKKED